MQILLGSIVCALTAWLHVSLILFPGTPMVFFPSAGLAVTAIAGFVWSVAVTRFERRKAYRETLKLRAGLQHELAARSEKIAADYELLKMELLEQWKIQRDILEINEREHKRLGQDLHDGLAQQLSGLSFMSKALQNKLAGKSLPEEEDALRILGFLKSAIKETQRISRGFYPVELENLGLLFSLKELTNNIEMTYSIPCHYQFDPSIEVLDDAVAKHVYRVAQEALSNAVKHAKPTRISLSLKRCGANAVLTVEDDGVGIDKEKFVAKLGVRIMEYRSKMMDAELSMEHVREGGTRVIFTFQAEGLSLLTEKLLSNQS